MSVLSTTIFQYFMSWLHTLYQLKQQLTFTPPLQNQTVDYDAYWEVRRGKKMGTLNVYQQDRVDWIKSRIADGDSVMDLGCGDGSTLQALQAYLSIDAVAVEFSDRSIQHLQEVGLKTICCDLRDEVAIEALPQADHLLLLEVLEHLPQPEEFLHKILPKARQSVIFSFPNTGYLSYRLRLLFGRFPVQWRLHPGEHLRFWTYADLQWWLNELELAQQAEIGVYQGFSQLNQWWPNLFGAALICQIKRPCNYEHATSLGAT